MTTATALMPVMGIEAAIARRAAMVEFVQRIMVPGTDFGVIPGTGGKPTLLKPGAEKLASLFALRPVFSVVEAVQDWTGENHGGEAFLSFWYRCTLYSGDTPVGEGDAYATSWEKKYRSRKAERACPNCGSLAISRSKFPPRDDPEGVAGWYCKDCKEQYAYGDRRITEQTTGSVLNPDIADTANTLIKMAQKRALVSAILVTCNASEFFIADLEDFADGEWHDTGTGTEDRGSKERPSAKTGKPATTNRAPAPAATRPAPADDNLAGLWARQKDNFKTAPMPSGGGWQAVHGVISDLVGGDANRHQFYSLLFERDIASSADLTAQEAAWLLSLVKPGKTPGPEGKWVANAKAENLIKAFWAQHAAEPQAPSNESEAPKPEAPAMEEEPF